MSIKISRNDFLFLYPIRSSSMPMRNPDRLEAVPILLHGGVPVKDIEDLMSERLARRGLKGSTYGYMVEGSYRQRSCGAGMIQNAGNPGANLGCPFMFHSGDRDVFDEILAERMRGVQDTSLVDIALNRVPEGKQSAPNRTPKERCACLLRAHGAPPDWTPTFPSDWIEQALALHVQPPKEMQCQRCHRTIRCHRPGAFDGTHSCTCPKCKVTKPEGATDVPCSCHRSPPALH